MTNLLPDPARPRAMADPLAASRRLAWLLTLAVHLALAGAWLAGAAWRVAPPPAPTPASVVLRLSPPAPAPPKPAP
ncbi:MAG: hypothetical protein V1797_15665, partial [Pseudomonadota bacterium]